MHFHSLSFFPTDYVHQVNTNRQFEILVGTREGIKSFFFFSKEDGLLTLLWIMLPLMTGENSRKGKAQTNGTTQLESTLHHLYGISKSTWDRKELNPCGSRVGAGSI